MDLNSGWTGGLYRLCEWVSRLVCLNLLWIGFSLLGGILLGLGPSTIAMFTVMKKWLQKEEFPVFRLFLSTFKKEFRTGNMLGALLILPGLFLYIDAHLLLSFEGVMKFILLGSFTTVLFLYSLILIYVFPVFVHYRNNLFSHLRSALLIGISYPFHTFLMVVAAASGLFVCFVFPAIAFLFAGGGTCFILTLFSQHLFEKVNEIEQGKAMQRGREGSQQVV